MAHLRYITRPQAARLVLQDRLLGGSWNEAAAIAEDVALRRKGRVCERFVVALPVEATLSQREALARSFAERMSKGIAGYVAAIHDQNSNDVSNPHAHFVFFDVQQKTGGRGRPVSVLGFARKNSIENAAQIWSEIHNQMMRGWGFGVNSEISCLSYASRGIEKIPMIHEGAGSRAKHNPLKSRNEQWMHIDQGRTRAEANIVIREINQLNEERINARELQLGASDGGNETKRGVCIAKQRAVSRGNGKADARTRAPFDEACEIGSNYQQTGNCTGRTEHRNQNDTRHRSHQGPPFLEESNIEPARRFRRRLGVRRIYRELIMLRDTLRARLMPLERRSRTSTNRPPQGTAHRSPERTVHSDGSMGHRA